MELKPRDIEIPIANPFKNDLLKRKVEIENLAPILCKIDGPFVFAIDSPWGTGKTTFIKLWQEYLKAENISSIYFNAWESDYGDDPLIAIISEIDKWVSLQKTVDSSDSAWKKAKTLLPGIAKSSAIATAKLATLGALDFEKEYEKMAAEFTGGVAENLIDSFNKKSVVIDEFRKSIKEVLSTLGSEQNNLLVFVDELDRCRPTYAIELLERIKHLFNIEKLVFVLSTDIEQLSHSICAVYGSEFNARKYLQRFVDIDYSLKKPNKSDYILSLFDSLQLNKYFSARDNSRNDRDRLHDCFVIMAKRFDLSLREINIFLTRIRLILLSIPLDDSLDQALIVSLLFIREYNPILYSNYTTDPGIADEVIEYLGTGLSEEDRYEKTFCLISGFLIAPNSGESSEERFNELLSFYQKISENGAEGNSKQATAAKRVIRVATHTRGFDDPVDYRSSIERIELLHRINLSL